MIKFSYGSETPDHYFSHAIEYLITQSLTPKITQAVILAGGKGLNMRPFTFEMPKGLFPVGGRPILEHIVEMLSKYDIQFVEKPKKGQQKSQLVSCGLYIFEPEIFRFFPKTIPFRLGKIFSLSW